MKKIVIALLALSAAGSAGAVQTAPQSTKHSAPQAGLTCVPPLQKLCRGWGRVVFCRCV